MHAEEQRRLGRRRLLDVDLVVLVLTLEQRAHAGSEHEIGVLIDQIRVEEHCEVRDGDAPVVRVGDVPAVHDLSHEVTHVGPRRGDLVGLEIVLEDRAAHEQVAAVEGVRARETHGAELAPAEHERVEEGEREEHGPVSERLGRLIEVGLAEHGPREAHVGLHVGGRLVGHLDGRLHDALGDEHERGQAWRLGGHEAAEVFVPDLGSDLELALKHRQPALHEVHVLQESPATLAREAVEHVLAVLLLALAHRDGDEVALKVGVAELLAQSLNLIAGVDTREEHKEEWRLVRRVNEGVLEVKGRLNHEAVAQVSLDEVRERGSHAICAQGADDAQLLEARSLLEPVARQVLALGLRVLDELAPRLHVELEVLGQRFEEFDLFERMDASPLLDGQVLLHLGRHRRRVGDAGARDEVVDRVALHLVATYEHAQQEHRRDDELVLVEEAATRVVEDLKCDIVHEVDEALVELLTELLGVLHIVARSCGRRLLLLEPFELELGHDHVVAVVILPVVARQLAPGDGALEDDVERGERVEVESVHLEQVREQEEHERAAVGHRTVHLRGLDHDHLGLLGDHNLLAHLD